MPPHWLGSGQSMCFSLRRWLPLSSRLAGSLPADRLRRDPPACRRGCRAATWSLSAAAGVPGPASRPPRLSDAPCQATHPWVPEDRRARQSGWCLSRSVSHPTKWPGWLPWRDPCRSSTRCGCPSWVLERRARRLRVHRRAAARPDTGRSSVVPARGFEGVAGRSCARVARGPRRAPALRGKTRRRRNDQQERNENLPAERHIGLLSAARCALHARPRFRPNRRQVLRALV